MCQVVAYKRFKTKENYKPSPRADLGVGPGGPAPPPSPFCGLLNISPLHVQYGIYSFCLIRKEQGIYKCMPLFCITADRTR